MVLRNLVQQDDWVTIQTLLQENRLAASELTLRDRLNRTPLHYAVAKQGAPPYIIHRLLDTAGVGMTHSTSALLSAVDIGGNSILHMAAATGNAMIVRVVLERISSQSLASHDLEGERNHHDDSSREAPFHPTMHAEALQRENRGTNEHVSLLQHHARLRWMCRAPNDHGLTPCLLAWTKYFYPSFSLFQSLQSARHGTATLTERQERHLSQLVDASATASGITSRVFLEEQPLLRNLWSKTLFLAYSATYFDMVHPLELCSPFDPLLELIRHGNALQCPTVAIGLALLLKENQKAKHRNHGNDQSVDFLPDGQTYLHLAAQSRPCPVLPLAPPLLQYLHRSDLANSGRCQQLLRVAQKQQSALIQVLRWQPAAASARDSLGRLPLHIALGCGHQVPWCDVQHLLLAYPASQYGVDPVTGLSPLLLAATSSVTELTTLYKMIQSRPAWFLALVRRKHDCDREVTESTLQEAYRCNGHITENGSDQAEDHDNREEHAMIGSKKRKVPVMIPVDELPSPPYKRKVTM